MEWDGQGHSPVFTVQESGWASRSAVDECVKPSCPWGFDPRTFHPVASRYTDRSVAEIVGLNPAESMDVLAGFSATG